MLLKTEKSYLNEYSSARYLYPILSRVFFENANIQRVNQTGKSMYYDLCLASAPSRLMRIVCCVWLRLPVGPRFTRFVCFVESPKCQSRTVYTI